jgi:hypothetical protein
MTPWKNEKRSIFGAIELATGRWLYHIAERATQRRLHRVPGTDPRRLPQGAGHRDRARQRQHALQPGSRALVGRPRSRPLLYGARYSPHHNPVERVWGAMKRHLANLPTLTMLGRIQDVHAFFRAHSRAQMLATSSPFNTPWLPPGYGQKLWKAA